MGECEGRKEREKNERKNGCLTEGGKTTQNRNTKSKTVNVSNVILSQLLQVMFYISVLQYGFTSCACSHYRFVVIIHTENVIKCSQVKRNPEN